MVMVGLLGERAIVNQRFLIVVSRGTAGIPSQRFGAFLYVTREHNLREWPSLIAHSTSLTASSYAYVVADPMTREDL